MAINLKEFNPDRIAELEAASWHAYYKHQFLKLLFLLITIMREFYGIHGLQAIKAGYLAANPTVDFRINKGKENQERILMKLNKFFQLVSDLSEEKFDHKKAAELERQWWFVDRYPSRYSISREQAIALAAAEMYRVDPSLLSEYSDYRAQAMVVQDVAEAKKEEADWVLIESLLKKAYESLYETLHK